MPEEKKMGENKIAINALIIVSMIWLFAIFMSACRTQYIQGETITKEVRVIERDTTIVTQADSASIAALLSCDSSYNVVLGDLEMSEGERINLEWRLNLMEKNGRTMAALNMKAKEEEQANNVTIKDTETNQVTERTVIEYRNSPFAKFCIGFFWTAVAGCIIGILIAVLKRRFLIS